MNLEGEKFGAQ
jgi:hypothetical protein